MCEKALIWLKILFFITHWLCRLCLDDMFENSTLCRKEKQGDGQIPLCWNVEWLQAVYHQENSLYLLQWNTVYILLLSASRDWLYKKWKQLCGFKSEAWTRLEIGTNSWLDLKDAHAVWMCSNHSQIHCFKVKVRRPHKKCCWLLDNKFLWGCVIYNYVIWVWNLWDTNTGTHSVVDAATMNKWTSWWLNGLWPNLCFWQ